MRMLSVGQFLMLYRSPVSVMQKNKKKTFGYSVVFLQPLRKTGVDIVVREQCSAVLGLTQLLNQRVLVLFSGDKTPGRETNYIPIWCEL